MTPRPDLPHDPPPLPEAESEAFGRHVQRLAQTVEAPPSLRARLADDAQRRAGARRRPRFALPAALAGGLAAVIAVVAVLAGVGGGGSAVPSVDDAAALALARPTAAAPAVVSGDTQLDAAVGNITFPNYAYQWPSWKATGARHDTLDGRDATTITYNGPKGDVGYTIVDGEPLPEPADARSRTVAGVDLKIYKKDGATVVTWRRDGHTCVLAGRGAGVEPQLVKFATWA